MSFLLLFLPGQKKKKTLRLPVVANNQPKVFRYRANESFFLDSKQTWHLVGHVYSRVQLTQLEGLGFHVITLHSRVQQLVKLIWGELKGLQLQTIFMF